MLSNRGVLVSEDIQLMKIVNGYPEFKLVHGSEDNSFYLYGFPTNKFVNKSIKLKVKLL